MCTPKNPLAPVMAKVTRYFVYFCKLRIYLMLQQYFTPIEDKTIYKPYQIGYGIKKYSSVFPEIGKQNIVIFGVQGEDKGTTAIRQHLYALASSSRLENLLVDLGDIPKGATPADTNSTIQTIAEYVLTKEAIPLLIGTHLDQGEALYNAFENKEPQVELTLISSHLPLLEYELLSRICKREPNYLGNISVVGFQAPYIPPRALDMLENLNFNHFRLGHIKERLEETEIHLRNATITLFDLNAIRHIDAPGTRLVQANGLTGEEACQLARYAGHSDLLQCYALLGYKASKDREELTAALCAQLIWYFADGVLHRSNDIVGSHEDFVKYRCDFSKDDVPILFIKSKRTARWWMSIEDPRQPQNGQATMTIPCTYDDYRQAANGETPQRFLDTLKKLS